MCYVSSKLALFLLFGCFWHIPVVGEGVNIVKISVFFCTHAVYRTYRANICPTMLCICLIYYVDVYDRLYPVIPEICCIILTYYELIKHITIVYHCNFVVIYDENTDKKHIKIQKTWSRPRMWTYHTCQHVYYMFLVT